MEEPLPTYNDSPRMPQHSSAAVSLDGQNAGVTSALARFEYEAEKTSVQDATKVLLIEWEEEHDAQIPLDQRTGEWTVEWKGPGNKREGISLKSQKPASAPEQRREFPSHRLYFLLQPGAPVPSSVSISFTPDHASSPTIAAGIPTLPAIFPPSLLTSGTSLGKKGVCHTLWAKSRLAALRAEIDEEEERGRFEGVGIEMARDELEWIKEHFGVSEKNHGGASDVPASPRQEYHTLEDDSTRGRQSALRDSPAQLSPPLQSPMNLPSPSSATSPSARLQEKMKGLRVGTSPSSSNPSLTPPTSASSPKNAPVLQPQFPTGVFTPPQTGSSNTASKNPLSPEVGDVAVGSRSLFAALKGPHPSKSQTPQPKVSIPTSAPNTTAKRPIAVAPPTSQSGGGPGFGMASLDGVANTGMVGGVDTGVVGGVKEEEETEEGLFALPMSPRSPEMEASPFSFRGAVVGGR